MPKSPEETSQPEAAAQEPAKKKESFFFPDEGRTVEAETLEEATKIVLADKQKK